MTETTVSPTVATPAEPAKNGKPGRKGTTPKAATKGKAKVATHPPTSEMVTEAIENLHEKKGSSLQAIKKYISVNYKLDATKANIFILKYLRSAVSTGKLIQTKGVGAKGSFKFPVKEESAPEKRSSPHKARKVANKEPAKESSPKKRPAPKKATKAKSPTKPKPKKLKVTTAKPKKASLAKKPVAKRGGKKKASPKNK